LFFIATALGVARPAFGAPGSPGEWLQEVDKASVRGDDTQVLVDLKLTDQRGKITERTLEILQKGTDKRLVRFTAPARLSGVTLLVPDGDTLYLYLPAYGRERRVIGDQRGDSFMGSDFSMEDLSRTTFGGAWTAQIGTVEGEHQWLDLAPKDASVHGDTALRIRVRAADYLVDRIESLDEKGALTRRLTLADFRDVQGRSFAHTLIAEDLKRGRKTEGTVTKVAFDAGITDDRFSVAALSRD
jgi:outer membrane lipoprotein-sorting protein